MNDAENVRLREPSRLRGQNRRRIRAALMLASVALVAVGIALGDNVTIFQKAVFVCMECIGIG